jgi:glycolate oxidase
VALSAGVRAAFERVLAPGDVISDPVRRRAYECDGLTGYRVVPDLVLLPRDAAQVAAAVRVCAQERVPFVARGAGTGLSGGALPVADGVVISLARLKRVLELDPVDRRAVVEPGVTNLEITAAAAAHGLYYAPDPSSQQVCTIGGNVAENSGGAHCLKYGFTTNHVLAVEVVLADGSVVTLGGDTGEQAGPDLRGVFLGSEGTLGIATKVVVRLLRTPETVRTLLADFPSIGAAGEVVGDVIGAGIVPAAIEMMDTLAIEAAEEAVHAGYTVGVPAALIVELDGPEAECDTEFAQVKEICERHGCTRLHIAGDGEERAAIWRGRKAAFAAVGRISPDYFVQDGVVPRTRLKEVLDRIRGMGDEAGLRVANVFHAGDGNLHPLVLYSAAAGETERAERLSGGIAELCVEMGGALSGEHGIGADKACSMPKMFGEDDLATMARVRAAFDPEGLCNPGKVLPTPRLCGERPGKFRAHPLEEAGVIERL